MTMMSSAGSWSVGLLLAATALGCAPGGVGDPCVPEDEYQQTFNGFQVTEVNVESRSFQCETRLCLVNHFQGRVSCSPGQTATEAQPYLLDEDGRPAGDNPSWKPVCSIPGTAVNTTTRTSKDNINVEVPPQLLNRQTDQAVYCSCRCDGDDPKARYCECPEGFQCTHLVDDLKVSEGSGAQLPGSYCIRSGTDYNPVEHFKGGAGCKPGTSSDTNCGCDPSSDEYPATCGAKPTAAVTP